MSVWPVGLFKAPVRSAAVVEDPAAARPQAQWLGIHCDPAAVAKLLRLAFPPSRRAKAPLRRDGGRHSRAPFGDSTAGSDRTYGQRALSAPHKGLPTSQLWAGINYAVNWHNAAMRRSF